METKMVKVDDSGGDRWRRFVPNWYLVILATTVIALLVIMISLILTVTDTHKVRKANADAIECPGFPDPDVCVDKGCTYKKATLGPSCFMEKDAFGYRVENVIQESDGPLIQLKRLRSHTPYGPSLKNVTFKLTYLTENILRFQFKDANAKRYEVPIQEEFPLLKEQPLGNDTENLIYEVTHSNQTDDVFHFTVKRKNGTYLWNSSIGALLLSDKYLQIGSYLPTRNVYGVGEHAHDTLRHRMEFVSWPLFAGDQPPQVPTNRKNLYGVHPFYTCLEDTGESHGVFFLNSNAMEVTFLPAPAVSFRTIGGILDFFIFVGDNSEHVVQLYTSLIGRPMIPPYWGLGFQLSRYGYRRIQELQKVMDRNRKARIPQAVQYVDIDHMDNGMDFTYNKLHFAGLPELMNSTRNDRGLKWIIIQEPFIAVDAEHYDSGVNRSIFVRRDPDWKRDMFPEEYNMRDDNVTFGKVWPPTYVAFLDFFLNETKMWWKEQLLAHRKTLPFDGLWIDMNEPANFGTNEAEPNYCWFKKRCWSLKCPNGPYETPAYNPLKGTNTNLLSDKTICMQSIQGEDGAEYLHYNVHSLYGWSQTQPTVQAAQEATGTRSLVISRSTYPSSGRYAGHWLGDNYSSYKHMQRSIIGILEFNLFGIPYVGADVCGFHNIADADLCKRWMQLGAFYPYYRNHNAKEPPPQDPASYEDQGVATLSRKAIERRLRFNPYLYTLFYKAHVQGSTVLRPVFHEIKKPSLFTFRKTNGGSSMKFRVYNGSFRSGTSSR